MTLGKLFSANLKAIFRHILHALAIETRRISGADSGGGAPGAPPPPKKKQREREERGSKEETIRSIRGKTSAEAFVISF